MLFIPLNILYPAW